MNISPVDSYNFSVFKSVQNIQVLRESNGCVKYVCKYIEKFDKKKYVVIGIYGKGKLVTKVVLLYNAKVAPPKMRELSNTKLHRSSYHPILLN